MARPPTFAVIILIGVPWPQDATRRVTYAVRSASGHGADTIDRARSATWIRSAAKTWVPDHVNERHQSCRYRAHPVCERGYIEMAGRNVEVMWLTCRLVPDHKTITDFRKDNGSAIKPGLRAIY